MSTLYQIGEVLINNSIRVLWVNNRNFYFTHLSVIYLSVLELLFILMCFLLVGKVLLHIFLFGFRLIL